MASIKTHPLTCVELDQLRCMEDNCQNPGHPLIIASSCHPYAIPETWYDRSTGVLTLRCSECESVVVNILIARDDSCGGGQEEKLLNVISSVPGLAGGKLQ